jgi:hypothetical protein
MILKNMRAIIGPICFGLIGFEYGSYTFLYLYMF